MKKRVVAFALWFLSGWFVGASLAFVAGLSPVIAPILGITSAAFVAIDPWGVIWVKFVPDVARKPARANIRRSASAGL